MHLQPFDLDLNLKSAFFCLSILIVFYGFPSIHISNYRFEIVRIVNQCLTFMNFNH